MGFIISLIGLLLVVASVAIPLSARFSWEGEQEKAKNAVEARNSRRSYGDKTPIEVFNRGKAPAWKQFVLATFAGLVLLIGSAGITEVPAGQIGVVTTFGKISTETLTPGIHLIVPIANNVHLIDTRVQPHAFQEIDAASKEYQSVKLSGVMNYHIDGQYASDLYQRVGENFADKVLDPAFNDYIKTVVPQYAITDILAKRDEIRQRAKSDLQANLAQYHVIVDDIYIANIGFSPEYEAAIENKQVAAQQVETEKQILAQKEIQAQQAVAAARGQADATVVAAKGQADSNALLTKSLTPELIQYTLIQKLGPDIKVIMMPTGQQFILDPSTLTTK